MGEVYRSNNVLVTMGGDFTYMQAGMWFENIDKLIQYGNLKAAKDGLNINLFYSTPDCYLKAVKDANPKLPIKQDDFFPYASDPHSYWTGYFTSRPTVKYLEAQTNIYLQMVKQLQVLAHLQNDFMPKIDELRSVMGVMQHHDAVTGTEKQHVARDYIRMVAKAVDDAHHITTAAFNKVMMTGVALEFDRCHFNESSCHTSEKSEGNLIVTVYNPLAWSYSTLIAVPVVGGDYTCQDGNGNKYEIQMMDIAEPILKIPYRESKSKREAYFIADLPPLGYKSFYLTRTHAEKTKRNVKPIEIDIEEYFNSIKHNYPDLKVIDSPLQTSNDNDVLQYIPIQPKVDETIHKINPDARAKVLLKTKGTKDKNVEEFEKLFEKHEAPKRRHFENPYSNMDDDDMRMLADDPMLVTRYPEDELADPTYRTFEPDHTYQSCGQQFPENCSLGVGPWYYPAVVGNNMNADNRSSGAYIFRPNAPSATQLHHDNIEEVDGPLFKEIRGTYPNNVYTAFKLSKNPKIQNEYDWLVGPIPIKDDIGKEYIIKYETPITTNGEFYTDSNGRQLLKRKLDKRPQWNLTLEEPVSGNYYPITSVVKVENSEGQALNIITDRAEGTASLEEGTIEVMVHRRLLNDDAFGVGEALNETVGDIGLVAKGTHRIHAEKITFKQVLEMRLQRQVFVTDASDIEVGNWKKMINEYSWLKNPLPQGIHLLTVEPWKDSTLLLRLENYLETTKEVDLTNILKGIEVKSVKEALLAANKWSENDDKWTWETEKEFADDFNKEYGNNERPRAEKRVKETDNGNLVKVGGKQMRTFVISYEKK